MSTPRKFAAFLRDVTVYQRELRLLMIFFEIVFAVSTLFQPAPQARMPQLEGINSSHPPVCNLASHETPGRFARVYQNHPVITARVLAVGGVGGVWLRNRCPGVNVR